jgi:hypothetical protein
VKVVKEVKEVKMRFLRAAHGLLMDFSEESERSEAEGKRREKE